MPKYAWNLLVFLSQGLNVILGGDPDESLSQRTARAYKWHNRHNRHGFWFKWLRYQLLFIDLLFWNKIWKIEQNHTTSSIEGEKATGEVWSWKGEE